MKIEQKTPTVFPRADRYLLFITVIWGSTFAVTKNALLDISPLMMQAVRFAVAAVMVGIYTWKDIRATSAQSMKAGLVLGALLGVGFALQTIGLDSTTASKAGFITGTMVVFTPLFQVVIERKSPTLANIIGVVLVGVGLYIFTSPAGSEFNSGDFLVLLCAIVFALYIVYLDVFTKKKFDREIVFYQFVVTSLIGFIAEPFLQTGSTTFTPTVIYSILYLSFFASTVALFIQSKYQRETTPTKAAIIFTMEPVFAAIIAYFALRETMSVTALVGAGIMFAGLLISELLSIKKNSGKSL